MHFLLAAVRWKLSEPQRQLRVSRGLYANPFPLVGLAGRSAVLLALGFFL